MEFHSIKYQSIALLTLYQKFCGSESMKTNIRPENAENGARQVHPLPIFFDLAADNFIRSKSGQKTLNRAVQELSIGVRLNEFRRLGTA